jgi:hypothetical protein
LENNLSLYCNPFCIFKLPVALRLCNPWFQPFNNEQLTVANTPHIKKFSKMATLTMAQSAYSSRTSLSTYNSGRTSTSSEHSIHLLCSIPGQLPRSSAPTPQRLIHVAASLSVHLANADLAHAFLGRFSLFLRGADVSPRWVDADVIKPIIGGLQRVKDVLALNPEFAIHGEVAEGGADRLLVSHRCGIYVRLSVGYVIFIPLSPLATKVFHRAVASLKKKINFISAHPNPSLPPVMLPCLTPAQQFLETVIIAASSDPKPEDWQDLVWMKDNLKMDIMSDPSTLKKTLGDGKVSKVIDTWPMMREVFMELGLVAVNDDDSVRSVSPNLPSTFRHETDLIATSERIKHSEPKPFKVQPLIQLISCTNRVAFHSFLTTFFIWHFKRYLLDPAFIDAHALIHDT